MTIHLKEKRSYHAGLSTSDRAFDELVPSELRHLSPTHWTPVEVAIRAASLLAPTEDLRILDIGAGVGKLCAIGALSSSAIWVGIEQHEILVTMARRLVRALDVEHRTLFIHGDAFAIDWDGFDALYLYNPFALPLRPDLTFQGQQPFDDWARVNRVQDRLAVLRAGTRIVTFNGFGGVMPASYALLYQERVPVVSADLVLWVQRRRFARPPGML